MGQDVPELLPKPILLVDAGLFVHCVHIELAVVRSHPPITLQAVLENCIFHIYTIETCIFLFQLKFSKIAQLSRGLTILLAINDLRILVFYVYIIFAVVFLYTAQGLSISLHLPAIFKSYMVSLISAWKWAIWIIILSCRSMQWAF